MKRFVTVILLFMFALAGIGATCFASLPREAGEAEVYAAQEGCIAQGNGDVCDGVFAPFAKEGCWAVMELGYIHSLAHRVSASAERLNRFFSFETSQFMKSIVRVLAARMNSLTHCSAQVYDTSRRVKRENACDYYVFGMRRILI